MTIADNGEHSAAAMEALAGQFQDLLRIMVDERDSLPMERVIDYARIAIPGADHAAITWIRRGGERKTIAASGDLPLRVDALQYSLNEGPCVAALAASDLVWVDDLSTDGQFPRFSPRAAALGVRSMLATRLLLSNQERACLNLYAERPGAFDASQLPIAAIFASFASLLLQNRLAGDRVFGLERALDSNREIGVAMGILMAQHRWSQSAAFERLVQASQHLNRRLRDIAAEVTLTRTVPGRHP